jgi:hypothetical protein
MESNTNEEEFSDIQVINYNNEKIYLKDIDEILELTKDNKTDWKKREAAIKKLGGIILGNMGRSQAFVKMFNQKIYLNLGLQIGDLRTSLMKEACKIVHLSAKILGETIEPAIYNLLSSIFLYKLIGSANKLISETSFNCSMQVLCCIESNRIISRIHEQMKNKSEKIKLGSCQHLLYILTNYSKNTMNKSIHLIEEFINTVVKDSCMEVRAHGRKLYFKYLEQFQIAALKMFNKFDHNVQKAISEDTNSKDDDFNANSIYQPNKNFSNSGNYSNNKTPELSPDRVVKKFSKTENKKSVSLTINTPNKNSNQGGMVKDLRRDLNSISISDKQREEDSECNYSTTSNISNKHVTHNNNENQEQQTPQSFEKPKFKNTEDLLKMQLNKIIRNQGDKEADMLIRFSGFEQISQLFNELYSNIEYITMATLQSLVSLHINNLPEYQSTKLTVQVMKNLIKFIFYLDNIFNDSSIYKIVQIVVFNIASENEDVSETANSLFEIMRKKLDSNNLIKPVIDMLSNETILESESLLEICFDIISPLIECSVVVMSKQDYLNSCFIQFTNLLIIHIQNKSVVKYKILDCYEQILKKYPKHFYQAFSGLNEELRNNLSVIFENQNKKFILENIKKNSSPYKNSQMTVQIKNETLQVIGKIQKFSNSNIQIKNLEKSQSTESSSLQEILSIAAGHEFQSFISYIKSDPYEKMECFLNSLSLIKHDQLTQILSHIYCILESDTYVSYLEDSMSLLLDKVIFLFAKFPEQSEVIRDIVNMISLRLDNELYLQIIPKYITTKQSPHITQALLLTIQAIINKINPENLLLLLPSFIEAVFNMLNHHISDVRKLSVFCIVDLYSILGQDFETYMQELPSTQVNLIKIYLEKKKGSG